MPYTLNENRLRANRRNMRARRAGVTWESLERLYDCQNGQCAVCRKGINLDDPRTHIDHAHNCCGVNADGTEKACGRCIRGILCHTCNIGAVSVADETYESTPFLAEARHYVKNYPASQVVIEVFYADFDSGKALEAAEALKTGTKTEYAVVSELAEKLGMKSIALGREMRARGVLTRRWRRHRAYRMQEIRAALDTGSVTG
jgi:Recombination endonuclease VII